MATIVNTYDQDVPTSEPQTPKGSSHLALWLVVLSLGFLLLPLFLIATTIQEENVTLAGDLETAQQALSVTPAVDPTESALHDTFTQLAQNVGSLNTRAGQLRSAYISWPAVINVVRAYDSTQMEILGLAQTDTHLTITGQAGTETTVTAYADGLRAESDLISAVVIQSITLKTRTPIPGNARTAATATPEPDTRYVEFVLTVEIQQGQSQ